MVGAPTLYERRRASRAPAQHSLLALQRTVGNRAATRLLARMKIVLNPLREARDGDKDIIDTSTLTNHELDALISRVAQEEKYGLYELLLNELEGRQEK